MNYDFYANKETLYLEVKRTTYISLNSIQVIFHPCNIPPMTCKEVKFLGDIPTDDMNGDGDVVSVITYVLSLLCCFAGLACTLSEGFLI